MPIRNLFKNCSYYWGFAAYVSYFVNHPLYTEPPPQVAVVLFLLAMAFQSCNLKLVLSALVSSPTIQDIACLITS